MGITVSGIILRPRTADYFDPTSRLGFSRNQSSGWNLEGMNPENVLGLDHENGHVNNRGLYHKHALSPYFKKSLTMSLVGSAADGFEIHYFTQNFKSSRQVKKGV